MPKTLQATAVKDSKAGILVRSLDQWRNAILQPALDEALHRPIVELTREKLTVDYLLGAYYLHVQKLLYARVNVAAINFNRLLRPCQNSFVPNTDGIFC